MHLTGFSVLVALTSVPWAAAQQLVGIKAGVNPVTGERPARLNINDLQKTGGPAWDLFIQALQAIEETPENDWLSWYQIAGIHGLPFKPYNGVENVPGGNAEVGYCPHAQITFITWHRPYIALLEQTLQAEAEKIAARYTGSSAAAYKAAAETLRFPYWDWANDAGAQMPPVTMEPTIQITSPTGPLTLHNPLYSYQFQVFPFTDPDFLVPDPDFTPFNETKRCTNIEEPDGINHFEIISDRLRDFASRLRGQVYTTFTQGSNFERMASTKAAGGTSFEAPHNTIHQELGGPPVARFNGHIRPVKWSAFDPIFWLHHTNVDRHFAMWQAIYYENATFSHVADGDPIFGQADGPITADTPLKPFVDGSGAFWTSKRVESTRVFGYTYPGLNDWNLGKEDLKKQVTALVNQLYGPQSTTPTTQKQKRMSKMARRQANSTVTRDYAVQIQVDRSDLAAHLPVSIEVHIDDILAGEYSLLSMPTAGVGGVNIPLQQTLAEAKINITQPASEVVTTLKEKMKVVVRKVEEEGIVPLGEVPSLGVAIEERDVTPAKSKDEFPVYGETTKWEVDVEGLSS